MEVFSVIKNKEILELLEKKKQEPSCDNCKYCDLNAYHNGKWYCSKRSIFDCPVDVLKCFELRN